MRGPICNVGWPGPSTTNGRGKRWKILFDERWITRVKQESHWPDSDRINGDFVVRTALDLTDEPDVYETGYWVAPKYAGQGMATEAANAAIRYAFGHLGAKAISIGYFDGNEASRRIVEKLGFQKLGVARQAATRCLDGTKLDRHEYILTSPDALPELDVSWG